MNHEGYPDTTPEKAMWGIRREERIRKLEEEHGVYRGEYYYILVERITEDPKSVKIEKEYRKMRVIGVYPHVVTLQDKNGFAESFKWNDFYKRRKMV